VPELCTFEPPSAPGAERHPARGEVLVRSRSLKLLRRVP
jgi:hypothetical protein